MCLTYHLRRPEGRRILKSTDIATVMAIEKVQLRNFILSEFRLNRTISETFSNIKTVYGEKVVSRRTIVRWFVRFYNGNYDLSRKPTSGRPRTINIDKLYERLQANPKLKTRELASELCCSHTSVARHLQALGIVKKSGIWIINHWYVYFF